MELWFFTTVLPPPPHPPTPNKLWSKSDIKINIMDISKHGFSLRDLVLTPPLFGQQDGIHSQRPTRPPPPRRFLYLTEKKLGGFCC